MSAPGEDTTDTMEMSHEPRLVLVADGNSGRGRRLIDECESAGLECQLAIHGAAALELALATQPKLVIARLDLPLVDAFKLSEILRANPRTRAVRFLFIGEAESHAAIMGVGDRLVDPGRTPHDIVNTVIEMLDRQERIESLDEVSGTGEACEGSLELLALADLLQSFMLQRRSGQLYLEHSDESGRRQRARILVQDGEVLQAEVGQVDGEKALFRLISWRQGRFKFEPGKRTETPTILVPTRRLLVEGLRQLEEWDRLAPQLPPVDAPVKLAVKSGELPNIVHPLTQEVLLLLELYDVVRDVVDHCVFPDYQVLRTLHTLSERGIVQLGRVPTEAPTRSLPLDRPFNEGQGRRLRDWLKEAMVPGSRVPDAKLLVVSSSPEAIPEFAKLLQGMSGVELGPRVTTGGDLSRQLVTMGRIAVDQELGIELIHVPADAAFAPLWPTVGHGALGTLFLLSGAVSEAASKVAPVAEALGRLPRARTFHVVLLGKEDRVAPDELRENLALIDEASLFLLPTESGKPPSSLLRSLFSRVMP